jgi:hypothetical protein
MLDMQVIEALYLKDEEPHDYLHIKQKSTCWHAEPDFETETPLHPPGCA